MSELAKHNYELAFHIIPNLDDADVQKTKQDLEKSITSRGGIISFAKDPEKVRLAYPIRHLTSAFFGYFNFSLESSESINQIREDLRGNANLLRSLVLKHIEESQAKKEEAVRRSAMAAEKRRARAMKPAEKPGASKTEGQKMDEKLVDEKLEEIIDKL